MLFYSHQMRAVVQTMRKTYLDNIRWITVCLVVVYHVLFIFSTLTPLGLGTITETTYQDAVLYLLYPWFMLLLFVVSGMCARFYLQNHSDRTFRKARTTKLLVPSTLGLLVFGWVLGYVNTRIGGGFDSLKSVPALIRYLIMCLSGSGVLWYVQTLWLFSMVLIPVRRLEKDRLWNLGGKMSLPGLLLLTIAVWGASRILNTPIIVVYRFGIYGLGFFLGYFIFSHDAVMDRLEKAWMPLTVAAAVLGAAFTIRFWGQDYAGHAVLDTFLCNAFAWITVLAVLSFMKKWGNFENAFSKWMTRKSWGLYLFHYLPLAICAGFVYQSAMPAVCKYLLTALAAFLGGFLLYEILSRIPFVRWSVCGIRKSREPEKE